MYIHLHSHCEASIADGLFHPKKWVEAYKEKGFKAAALTDHGVMTSLYPFYKEMKDAKLHPILGVEFYFVDNPLEKVKENRKTSHLVLLAQNYEGFVNLMKLSKLSFIEGYYYRQRIGWDWLEQHKKGLICLSACQGGVLMKDVWEVGDKEAFQSVVEKFERLHRIFGKNFYIEFQGHAGERQTKVNKLLYQLRNGWLNKFQPIITNDNHYILPEHAAVQRLLKEVAYKSNNSNAASSYTECDSLWLKTPKEIYETFRKEHEYLPKNFLVDAMRNTEEVLEKCKDFSLPTGKRYLPVFRANIDKKSWFKKLILKEFSKFIKEKEPDDPGVYKERFKKEYKVISKYNLEDYFLIVWDIIAFCKKEKIYVGLGRGSAAGSLISYILGIVKLDPIEHRLIFERFLNENRCKSGELPDIDLDIESERRDEVKEFILKTYGQDKVCGIGTYGRMKLKTSLIDFGKAIKKNGKPLVTQRQILDITTSLNLDKNDADNIEAAIDASPELHDIMVDNLDYAYAVETIIGQIKSQSIHPAGMVICSDNVANITPIKTQKAKNSNDRVIVTQFEDKYVIAQGLMKMDILGLKEYDIVKYVIENSKCPFTVDNYIEEILKHDDDPKVWELFQRGESCATFQFSSEGMQDLLRMMKPDCINDLIAANALYRPGCLENGWHLQYCERKHGREKVEYVHEDLEKALGETYGVIVFQEQFMEAIHKIGDIKLVDTDTIRSALGKKDKNKLRKFENQFIKNAKKKIGISEAQKLWSQIERASNYAFNRSHSAAYSCLAFISQYLKVHYPNYFWAAHMDWDTRKNRQEEMLKHKKVAQGMGVKFLMPHINKSKARFQVERGKPRWSFAGIKGIGEKTAAEIEKHQPFKDFKDFYKRVNKSKVKFNNMVNLIYAGAFDEFGDRKGHLKWLYEEKNKRVPKLSDEHMLESYLEVMGFFEQQLKKIIPGFSRHCVTETKLKKMLSGEQILVGGMLINMRSIKTKKGDEMAFGNLVDKDESIDLTFFPTVWLKHKSVLKNSKIIEVKGYKSNYKNKNNLIEVSSIREV